MNQQIDTVSNECKVQMYKDLYLDCYVMVRHHDDQRVKSTNLTTSLSIGLLAAINVISQQPNAKISVVALSALVIIISLYGLISSRKIYERIRLNHRRGDLYAERLVNLTSEDLLLNHIDISEVGNRSEFPLFNRIRYNWVWSSVHILFVLCGLYFLLAFSL